jgi:hypothetical protein
MPKFTRLITISFLIALLAFLYVERKEIFALKYLGDLHMHTTCSDGQNTYEEMVQTAIKDKLSFMAITDHRTCADVIRLCSQETRIKCFPGQEVSSPGRHLLAINITKYIDPDLPLTKQVQEIHAQGGIAIAAHPNFEDFYYTDSELEDSGIDAQECTNDSKERRPLPCVWDSDAHNTSDLAWQFNSCTVPIKNINDLKTAIVSHECSRATTLPIFSVQNANIKE